MKIWTCGSSPRSGSRNAWTRIKNINSGSRLSNFGISRRDPNDFLSVAIGDHGRNMVILLWPETSNNQWSGGIAAHPAQKIPSSQISWKISRLNFLVSRRHPPQWLSSKEPNYQRGVLFISAGAIEGHFEGKTPLEFHQGGLVLARQCPGSPGTCNPEETGLPGLPVSSPDLTPSDYHLFPGLKKKAIERSPFFVRRCGHCCRGDRVRRTTFWIFLSGLQKLEQRSKKCIHLRGGVCWINPEYGRCSLFPSWTG